MGSRSSTSPKSNFADGDLVSLFGCGDLNIVHGVPQDDQPARFAQNTESDHKRKSENGCVIQSENHVQQQPFPTPGQPKETMVSLEDNKNGSPACQQSPGSIEALFFSDHDDPDDENLKSYFPPRSPSSSAEARYNLRPGSRVNGRPMTVWVDQDRTGTFDPNARYSLERTRIVLVLRLNSQRWSQKLQKLKLDENQHINGRSRGDDNWPIGPGAEEPNQTLITSTSISQSLQRVRKERQQLDEGDRIPKLGDPAARGCFRCLEEGRRCSLIDGSKYPCNACEDDYNGCKLVMEPPLKDSCKNCDGRKCSFKSNRYQKGDCDHCMEMNYDCCYGPASGYTRFNPCLGESPEVFTAKRMPILHEERGNIRKRGLETDSDGDFNTSQTPLASSTSSDTMHEADQSDKARNRQGINRKARQAHKSSALSLKSGEKMQKSPSRSAQLPKRPTYTRYTRPFRRHKHADKDINTWGAGPALIKLQTWPGSSDDEAEDVQRQKAITLPRSPPHTPPERQYCMSGALPPPPRRIGEPMTITTRLWHPITINHERNLECTWCNELVKVVLGAPTYSAQVQETEDGFTVLNAPGAFLAIESPLKMCGECTSIRLSVAMCDGHQVQRIAGSVEKTFDEICAKLLNSGRRTDIKMCSICPRGAEYSCVKTTGLGFESARDQVWSVGCGLKLCSGCFESGKVTSHDVEMMVSAMEAEGKGMMDIRADSFMFGHVRRRLLVDVGMAD